MPGVNPEFLFDLSPEAAIEYLVRKNFLYSWSWRDVYEAEHNNSFTVAKVMKLDILKDIREMVEEAVRGDITPKEFYANLEPKLRAKGWWGNVKAKDAPGYDPASGVDPNSYVQLGSPHRLKKILEINQSVAYNAGREKIQLDAVNFAPYWRYIDMDDARVRPMHRRIGKLFEKAVLIYSHPFWQIWYPPNDWLCRCGVQNYTKDQVEERGLKIMEDIPQWLKDAKPGEGWAHNPLTAWQPGNS